METLMEIEQWFNNNDPVDSTENPLVSWKLAADELNRLNNMALGRGIKRVDVTRWHLREAAVAAGFWGHLDVLTSLYENYGDLAINQTNGSKKSVLMYTSENAQLEIVKFILKIDASLLEERDVDGRTAVMYAAQKGNIEVLRFYADFNANLLTTANWQRESAIMLAAKNGHLQVVQFLVEKLRSVESDFERLRSNKMATVYASEHGHVDVVKFLTEIESSYLELWDTIRSACDCKAFLLAAQNGHLEVVKYILTNPIFNARHLKGEKDRTAMMLAARFGHLEIVKLIDALDPNAIRARDIKGRSPVMFACENGHLEIVSYLTSVDSRVLYDEDNNGRTAIFYSVNKCQPEVLEFLANLDGCLVSKTYFTGQSLLITALEDVQLNVQLNAQGRRIISFLLNHTSLPVRCTNWRGNNAAEIAYEAFAGEVTAEMHGYLGAKCNMWSAICFDLLRAGLVMLSDPFGDRSLYWAKRLWHGRLVVVFLFALELRQKSSLNLEKLWSEGAFEYDSENFDAAIKLAPEDLILKVLRQKFPRQLQAICRTATLRHLPLGLSRRQEAIRKLCLPKSLEQYLNFSDIEEILSEFTVFLD